MVNVGIYGGSYQKESGVVKKLSKFFDNPFTLNGFEVLPTSVDHDLTMWMPDIDNSKKKEYPTKDVGSVLICSKLMHDGVKDIDAVSRIFEMRGNAVICVYTDKHPFTFKLLDALGNTWYNGSELKELATAIMELYIFTKKSVRLRSKSTNLDRNELLTVDEYNRLDNFIKLNTKLKDHIQTSCGDRFFGNLSTRCSKLFPSMRSEKIWVSPRNVNKEYITADDMVLATMGKEQNVVLYDGNKPSVDAPVQLLCYRNAPKIRYMIHGHANIEGIITTKNYYLCGDIREEMDVSKIMIENRFGAINLKNHGFLIYANTFNNLEKIINNCITKNRFTYQK